MKKQEIITIAVIQKCLSGLKKILKYNPGEKSLKAPFAIYLDLECLLKREQSCQNNHEKPYTEINAMHEPSGWAMFTSYSFDEKENKLYIGKIKLQRKILY